METTTNPAGRHDLYVPIHKALRGLMFEVATASARADWADPAERGEAAARVRGLVDALDVHSEHEDAAIMPRLLRVAPEVHHALDSDHTRVDGMHRELRRLVERLEGSTDDAERESLGRRLQAALHELVATHLRHMAVEEREAQDALWAHFTDAELLAMHEEITRAIPLEQFAAVLALILGAVSRSEGRALLAGVRAVPSELVGPLTAPARAALGEARWKALVGELALPAAA